MKDSHDKDQMRQTILNKASKLEKDLKDIQGNQQTQMEEVKNLQMILK